MFVSAFLTHGLSIRPGMGGGLHDTGSIHLSPALCMGRMGHALCCTGSVTILSLVLWKGDLFLLEIQEGRCLVL